MDLRVFNILVVFFHRKYPHMLAKIWRPKPNLSGAQEEAGLFTPLNGTTPRHFSKELLVRLLLSLS